MMCYRDTTFCLGHCETISCHRNKKGAYYNGGPKEDWMPISLAPFHLSCTHYQPEKFNEDNKQINS